MTKLRNVSYAQVIYGSMPKGKFDVLFEGEYGDPITVILISKDVREDDLIMQRLAHSELAGGKLLSLTRFNQLMANAKRFASDPDRKSTAGWHARLSYMLEHRRNNWGIHNNGQVYDTTN